MQRTVPPDTAEREKIIGGLFDVPQICWLAGGVLGLGVIPCLLFKSTANVPLMIFFLVFGLAFGASFAFIKIKGLSLFGFIKHKIKFKRSTHFYTNQGELVGEIVRE